jgi:hypothetical protein
MGWADPTLAFFTAPFLGLAYAAFTMATGRGTRSALPYGPHLALATALVIVAKPWFESGLSALAGRALDLP